MTRYFRKLVQAAMVWAASALLLGACGEPSSEGGTGSGSVLGPGGAGDGAGGRAPGPSEPSSVVDASRAGGSNAGGTGGGGGASGGAANGGSRSTSEDAGTGSRVNDTGRYTI